MSLVVVGAVTLGGVLLRVNALTIGFVFLVAVLLLSLFGGASHGTAGSLLSMAFLNFFFLPPYHTLSLEDPSNWIALGAFLATAIVTSRLVTAARVQAERVDARRTELEALYGLSVDLFTATNRTGALGEAAGRALATLGAPAGGLVLFDGSPFRQNVVFWKGPHGDEVEDMIAGVGRHKEPVAIPSPFGQDVYVPLQVGGRTTGAFVVRGATASREALDSAGRLVALAIERERFIDERAHLQGLEESDALKTSLLRAVSHDLTTPLTSIAIRVESLTRFGASHPELVEDVKAIRDEASRLRRRVENLLSMARLEAGKLTPRAEPTPPGDIFRAVRESIPSILEARPLVMRVDGDCPDVLVDPSLALEILVNLVENAHRASPPGEPIEIVARRHPIEKDEVRIEVLDSGPGLPASIGDEQLDGRAALADGDEPRRGLGLEIARSLAVASGGMLGLSNRSPGGGAVARVDLPAVSFAKEEAET